MRYWQHNETGRLLKINVQMAPIHWTEITEEDYNFAVQVQNMQTGRIPSGENK